MLPKIDMSDKNEVICSMVIEQAMEPVKPKIMHIEKSPGVNFVRFYACLQDFDVFNRNNRKYLYEPMVESWNAPHLKELMKYGDLFGEAGHPISKDPTRVVTIDPKVSCHRILNVEFKNKAAYGVIETLNDDMFGKQFTQHILQGCYAAFSLRALAPLTKIDATRMEIRSKCHIVTEDRVILPSHSAAYQQTDQPVQYVNSITTESSTNIWNNLPFEINLESYGNKNVVNVNESFDINDSRLINYLLSESHNVKEISDHFEVPLVGARLSKDMKNVIITESDNSGGTRIYNVKLEKYIRNEVRNILAK